MTMAVPPGMVHVRVRVRGRVYITRSSEIMGYLYFNIASHASGMSDAKRRATLMLLTVGAGDNDKFSTVALSSSTLALIGAPPLLRGFISTRILRSLSSSESVSELE